ncbi:unnamed protein product [Parajaminaea phylloscopi]
MSTSSNSTLAELVKTMNQIAPLSLADTTWDNVGVLLEAPFQRTGAKGSSSKVHLCIDLTTTVCQEALEDPEVGAVLCYHPIIFRGLKSLRMSDPQQATLLRLAAAGISVYSPHTSLDAAVGGINDMLALACSANGKDGIEGGLEGIKPCTPSKDAPKGHEGSGMGRSISLTQEVGLLELVQRIKSSLGLQHLHVARPAEARPIRTIAVCAGSGSSVLAKDRSDCWLTGEMSHHELLAATQAGRTVILANHSNSERPFLRKELARRIEEESQGRLTTSVSSADRDPLETV